MAAHRLKFLFDLPTPIIQAPMAGVATPELAAAVSNAGGLGSLGLGASSASSAKQMIQATQALTTGPIHVNVFCHEPAKRSAEREQAWLRYISPLFASFNAEVPKELKEIYPSFLQQPDMLQVLLETRPQVVSFHFGLPLPEQLAVLRDANIKTMAAATNLHEARLIEQAGIDVVIAQGIEAGGHRGVFDLAREDEQLSTTALVKQLVQNISRPIVAAGGIMDAQGIQTALELGASAVQMGTAFIVCPESAADSHYRQTLQSPKAANTKLTAAISGRPARGVSNPLVALGEAPNSPPPAAYPMAYDAAKQLNIAARKAGNYEFGAYWAGQNAPLVKPLPAAELLSTIMRDLENSAIYRQT